MPKASYNDSGSTFSPVMQHVNASVDYIERPLMTPDEVSRLRPAQKEGDGDDEKTIGPGQILIFTSGNYPNLGTQMLYFLDPVLRKRAGLPPPSEYITIEGGRVEKQRSAALARNLVSRPESIPADTDKYTNGERSFFEEIQIEGYLTTDAEEQD